MQSAAPTRAKSTLLDDAVAGWVKKQPLSSTAARTPWAESQIQRRFFRCSGISVEYFNTATSTTPRGRFDLRSVTSLSASAPATITVGLGALSLVLDFGWATERQRWLRAWASGVRIAACALDAESAAARDETLARELEGVSHAVEPPQVDDEDDAAPPPAPAPAKVQVGLDMLVARETIVKSGLLWKEGHVKKTWKQRRFELTSHGVLKYYSLVVGTSSPRLLDTIRLGGCSVWKPKTARPARPHAFRLNLAVTGHVGEKEKYILSGDTAEESSEWQQAILRFAALPVAPPPATLGRRMSSKFTLMIGRGSVAEDVGGGAAAAAPAAAAPAAADAASWVSAPAPPSRGGRRRVLVLGASGNVGQATLHWIVQSDASGACEILAGARDPHALATPRGVRAVRAEMTSGPDEVEGAPPPEWMRGLDVLVIITPGNDERVPATLRTARQASAAGVAQLIVVSVSTAELADSIFGKQFEEIERGVAAVAAASSSALHFTIVRLPLFLENYYGFAQSVRDNDAIRCAVDPAARYSPIAVTDVGEALAAIATDTSGAHLGATLSLAGASHTFAEVAAWLGDARGAAVRCERIGTDECRDALLGFGFQQWQADGVLELYDLISAGRYDFESAALEALLGHPPVSVQAWVTHAAPAFAAVASDRAEADSGRDAASSVASLSVDGGGEGASDDDEEEEVAAAADDDGVPRPRAPTVAAQAAMEELWQRVVLLEEQGEMKEAAELQAEKLVEIKEEYDAAARLRDMMP
jgi:hypothetical protein